MIDVKAIIYQQLAMQEQGINQIIVWQETVTSDGLTEKPRKGIDSQAELKADFACTK